ncbi:hypothetical protein COP2_039233 [Malus domestica]
MDADSLEKSSSLSLPLIVGKEQHEQAGSKGLSSTWQWRIWAFSSKDEFGSDEKTPLVALASPTHAGDTENGAEDCSSICKWSNHVLTCQKSSEKRKRKRDRACFHPHLRRKKKKKKRGVRMDRFIY